MNRRLRARHRWMTTALAVIVPVVLIAALATRPSMPSMDALPWDTTGERYTRAVAEPQELRIDDTPVRLTLLSRDADRSYAVAFEPYAGQAIAAADVLVYWAAEGADSWPPDDAFLLGALAGAQDRVFELPEAAGPGRGGLVFYSLAQQRRLEPGWALPSGEPRP